MANPGKGKEGAEGSNLTKHCGGRERQPEAVAANQETHRSRRAGEGSRPIRGGWGLLTIPPTLLPLHITLSGCFMVKPV